MLREAQTLDASTFVHSTVDTSDLAVAEVVRRVRPDWRPRHQPYGLPSPAWADHRVERSGSVLWL